LSKLQSPQGHNSDQKKSDAKNPKRIPNVMKYSGMAFQMGIIIWIGTFLGQKADAYFQLETPYLAALGATLALFIALYTTFKDLLFNK
jgi:apolipoprotein N-acyltransferase